MRTLAAAETVILWLAVIGCAGSGSDASVGSGSAGAGSGGATSSGGATASGGATSGWGGATSSGGPTSGSGGTPAGSGGAGSGSGGASVGSGSRAGAGAEGGVAAGADASGGSAGSDGRLPTICTSATTWNGRAGIDMQPGTDCLVSCHQPSMPPTFKVAGTVYPTLHEADDCNGTDGVAPGSPPVATEVYITDAKGLTMAFPVLSSGNFFSTVDFGASYTAKIVRGTTVREMETPQTSGDCNACHTEAGTNGAPGRILAP